MNRHPFTWTGKIEVAGSPVPESRVAEAIEDWLQRRYKHSALEVENHTGTVWFEARGHNGRIAYDSSGRTLRADYEVRLVKPATTFHIGMGILALGFWLVGMVITMAAYLGGAIDNAFESFGQLVVAPFIWAIMWFGVLHLSHASWRRGLQNALRKMFAFRLW